MSTYDAMRRCDVQRRVPAETAISEAMRAVEDMPADVRLTDAVVLLQAARDSVGDYVDGVMNRRDWLRDWLAEYVRRQSDWSVKTFGPGRRFLGIVDHIQKELDEIHTDPSDLSEWIDVMILAIDGYWRNGGRAEDLATHLQTKQDINFGRTWPKPTSEDVAVEHVR